MLMMMMIFFSGMLKLILVRKFYLMSLLSLEIMMVSLFGMLFFYFIFFFFEMYFIILFIVMGVCEGVLGLALMVYMVRKSSLDFLSSISLC